MTGRKSTFTQEVADIICERLVEGESLRSICSDEDMPNKSTVFRWLQANEAFRDQYARAKEAQAEALIDEIFDIADDARNDWMEKVNQDGEVSVVLNRESVQRSKLRVDARMWAASKMLPKKYGDKQAVELSGSVDVKRAVEEMTDDELAAIATASSR